MKPHLAEAAADRLARAADDAPMAEEEVLRVLARIARTAKPGDRLRAAELIGKQLGMFRGAGERGGAKSFAEMVLAAQRKRELPAANEVVDLMLVEHQEQVAAKDEVATESARGLIIKANDCGVQICGSANGSGPISEGGDAG